MTKGYLTFAHNSGDTDYVRMAYALAMSLKATQSGVSGLTVVTDDAVPDAYRWAFDAVVRVPWGDDSEGHDWKVHNKWKAIHASPYDETVLLDADMLFFSDVSRWWKALRRRDAWACTHVRTYRDEPVTSWAYRRAFEVNELPNVYTAFTYFKKTPRAFDLFHQAKLCFWYWGEMYETLEFEHRPDRLSGDVAFAVAMRNMDARDEFTDPLIEMPTFTHMKSQLQGWAPEVAGEQWTRHIPVHFTDDLACKIGVYRQLTPLHYHAKDFLTDEIINHYERNVQ